MTLYCKAPNFNSEIPYYHAFIDKCASNYAGVFLEKSGYNVCYFDNDLEREKDEDIGLLAIINKSVLITSDVGFFNNHNYNKILLCRNRLVAAKVADTDNFNFKYKSMGLAWKNIARGMRWILKG